MLGYWGDGLKRLTVIRGLPNPRNVQAAAYSSDNFLNVDDQIDNIRTKGAAHDEKDALIAVRLSDTLIQPFVGLASALG